MTEQDLQDALHGMIYRPTYTRPSLDLRLDLDQDADDDQLTWEHLHDPEAIGALLQCFQQILPDNIRPVVMFVLKEDDGVQLLSCSTFPPDLTAYYMDRAARIIRGTAAEQN